MGREYRRSNRIEGVIPFGNDILMLDTFDNGLKWIYAGDGTDYVLALSDYKPFRGSSSLYLANDDAIITDDDMVAGKILIPTSPAKSLILSTVFRPGTPAYIKYIDFTFELTTLTKIFNFGFRINRSTGRLQYMDVNQTYVDVSSDAITLYSLTWFRFSFNLNLKLGKYVTVTFQDKEYDISDIACYTNTGSYAPRIDMRCNLTQNGTSGRASCYLDNFVIFGA